MKADIESFLQKTPFFRLFIAFTAGILFQFFIGFNACFFFVCTLTSACLIIADFFIEKSIFRWRWVFGTGFFLLLFSVGLYGTKKASNKTDFDYFDEERLYFCEIIDAPVEKAKSVLCKVRLISTIDNASDLNNNMIIYLPKDSASLLLNINDRLFICARFLTPSTLGNPNEFDYGKYLKYKGIAATAYVSDRNWKRLNDKPIYSIRYFSNVCKKRVLSICKELGIAGDEFAVLAALTLGHKDELTSEIKESFSGSGAMHLLAVSGLHVGVIFMVFNVMLGFLDRTRKTKILKTILIIIFLWQYAFIVGLPPSAVRASIMLSLGSFAIILKRKSQTYNTIFATAFFMLLYNPYYIFDIGFQLSYVAVLSIVYFHSKLIALLTIKNKFLKYCWSSLCISLAAQLGTTPICLFYFNLFPNYFWLTNMIIVPLASVIIYSFIALFFLHWIPYLNVILATLLTWTVKIGNYSVDFIYHLPYSVMNSVWLEKHQVFLMFLIIIAFSAGFVYRKYNMFVAGCAFTILFLCVNIFFHYQTISGKDKLIVSAIRKDSGILLIKRNESYVLTNNILEEHRAMSYFRMRNRIEKPQPVDESFNWFDEDNFISFSGKKILVLSDNIFKNKMTDNQLYIDYLILTSNTTISIQELQKFVLPKKVIVDLSYYDRNINKIKEECYNLGIECFVIKESGAFIEEIG